MASSEAGLTRQAEDVAKNATTLVGKGSLVVRALGAAVILAVLYFASQGQAPSPASAQGGSETPAAPIVVKAGVYILSIGQLNTATGTYVVDMYLTLDCSAPCGDNSFEFMNGRATSTDLVESEPNYKSYRIQAALQTNPDLRQYPFDRQNHGIRELGIC